MHNHYSDLQVVPEEEDPKYLVSASYEPKDDDGLQETYPEKNATGAQTFNENPAQARRKKICGLPAKIFWILVAVVVVVVVAAAVGGGVGGVLVSKSHSQVVAADVLSSSTSTTSTASSPSTTSTTISSLSSTTSSLMTTSTSSGTPTTSTIIISTSTTQSPEYTLLVDCPSSNWTIYTPPGTSQMFRKICQNAVLNQNGIDAVVNTPTSDLDSCTQLCAAYNVENVSEIQSGDSDVCNAVCWRDTITGDDWPGQCFGYSTRNSSSQFILTSDSRCAGAALINQ